MKTIYSSLTSLSALLLIVLFLNGCGKKQSSEGTVKEETKKEKTSEESGTAGEVTKESTSSGSTNTDKMIDEYQEIVDQYVSIVKEVKNGNMSNLKDMQELATRTQEWSKKITEIAPTLTPAQEERLKKISSEAEEYLKK